MIRVGLIGPPDREELVRLSIRLEERSAEGVLLDSRKDPVIRIAREGESACGVNLTDVSAFYVVDLGLRSSAVRKENGELDLEASASALSSSRRHLSAWNSLLAHLSMRCPVVNPPQTHDLHSLKPWETAVYGRMGIPVPVTLATSDAGALLNLPGDPPGGWIHKGMVGGCDYTEEFTPADSVNGAREKLRLGPLMVQERIMGDNLRAFVLDGVMIGAAEVISRAGTETDTRRGDIRVRRVTLPDEAARAAVAAADRWGMIFAAVDFMVDARTGRHIILECNSAPFFVNFESMTGVPVSSMLSEYLVGRRPSKSLFARCR
jgi:glutathione synthase/RimK-type ligase-like ATP-grasp enzyme